jgi:membrane-associated phospholipid phosphatase
MDSLLAGVTTWDAAASGLLQDARTAPLTALFVVASAWWVKGLLLAGLGGVADLRRRRLPHTALWAGIAAVAASIAAAGIKLVVERSRPPLAEPGLQPAVSLPGDYSFPSGHAATAFAAAAAVAVCYPRLRWAVLGLAALVALSRVYLGVHFTTDVVAGAALGTAIGLATALLGRRLRRGVAAGRLRPRWPARSRGLEADVEPLEP